jgi:hypothetical protein
MTFYDTIDTIRCLDVGWKMKSDSEKMHNVLLSVFIWGVILFFFMVLQFSRVSYKYILPSN